MKHIRIIYLTGLYCALTLNSSSLCMLSTKFCKANRGTRYITYDDMQQGRRDAYQKWCPTKITWPDEDTTQKIKPQNNDNNLAKKDDMEYYKQYMEK